MVWLKKIEFYAGSWYEALRSADPRSVCAERFDVILATPPQTPGPQPFGPKYGGPDGTINLFKIVGDAPTFSRSGPGQAMVDGYFAGQYRNELWIRLQERFFEVSLIRETDRDFTAGEYE